MKIGILTHYYQSNNYGGVLQAYALVRVLRKMGYDAEQICFPFFEWSNLDESCIKELTSYDDLKEDNEGLLPSQKHSFIKIFLKIKRFFSYLFIGKRLDNEEFERRQRILKEYFQPRENAFKKFRDTVPHSNFEYSNNALFLLNEYYDAFVSGSDQVWNLNWQSPAFFLEFADTNKKKIAYAASAGMSVFDQVQQKYLKRVLPQFDSISVREEDLIETFNTIANVNVELVLDSVLLLDRDEWDEISSERIIAEEYLFAFFYNPSEEYYQTIQQYALNKGLKIVIIPFALRNQNQRLDDSFGDYHIGYASPTDFISLIKFASCVITDSFHACVFSIIYNKPFFVFERKMKIKMGSRLSTLTSLCHCEERYCNQKEKQKIEYISNIPFNKNGYDKKDLNFLKKTSTEFIRQSLS